MKTCAFHTHWYVVVPLAIKIGGVPESRVCHVSDVCAVYKQQVGL